MIEAALSLSSSSSFSPVDSVFRAIVPRDVIIKYDVERNVANHSVQDLLRSKISESVVENEAFYIVDLGVVARKFDEWSTYLPRVKPFYAIKCNPDNAIIKLLGSLGAGFDCASRSEIQQILGSGVDSSRIIFANPCKMKSHIEFAKSNDVPLMTFDNTHELTKIAEIYPDAKLVLRIITDDSQSVCRFSTKFGAPLDTTYDLLTLAKSLGLNVVGVSFHVGSGCMSVSSFISAIRSAHHVFQQAQEIGFNLTLLDLGGGWPGTNDGRISFPSIADGIRPIIDELFPAHVEVIAEPGRFFSCESYTLAVNIYAKRTVVDQTTHEKHFLYYINEGVYQSFNCVLYDHYNPTPLILNARPTDSNTPIYRSTIFGPTCDSIDCIGKDIPFPELEVGDWLYFKNMGAYTLAAGSPFNGFKAHSTTFYIH